MEREGQTWREVERGGIVVKVVSAVVIIVALASSQDVQKLAELNARSEVGHLLGFISFIRKASPPVAFFDVFEWNSLGIDTGIALAARSIEHGSVHHRV